MKKVLLVGIGRWGANHLRVLHSLPIEFYVTDLDPKRLESARKMGISEDHLSTTYQDFAERVDAVVLVTPAQSHFALCREFLSSGKDVFVEKPMTLVTEEARELAELAAKEKRILQVGHIFRFDPATQWLRQAIRAGQFGSVHMLRGHFGGFKRPRNDSGVMFADGIHFVDLFNYFLDAIPVSVHAIQHDFLGRGMDDVTLLSLEYEREGKRTWATVEAEYFIPGKFREVVVVGSELSAICDYNVAQYKIKTHGNRHVAEGRDYKGVEGIVSQIETPPEEPLLAELRAFISSLETREESIANGWAGYESVRVLNAALESVRLGRPVPIQKMAGGGG